MLQDCIFCMIGSGQLESEILHRDDSCFVIRDIAPKAPVHLLIITPPALHLPDGSDPRVLPSAGQHVRGRQGHGRARGSKR